MKKLKENLIPLCILFVWAIASEFIAAYLSTMALQAIDGQAESDFSDSHSLFVVTKYAIWFLAFSLGYILFARPRHVNT